MFTESTAVVETTKKKILAEIIWYDIIPWLVNDVNRSPHVSVFWSIQMSLHTSQFAYLRCRQSKFFHSIQKFILLQHSRWVSVDNSSPSNGRPQVRKLYIFQEAFHPHRHSRKIFYQRQIFFSHFECLHCYIRETSASYPVKPFNDRHARLTRVIFVGWQKIVFFRLLGIGCSVVGEICTCFCKIESLI